MQQATHEAVKKKFVKKRSLVSKTIPRYPQSLEREYIRVINTYMKQLNNILAEYIPRISDILNEHRQYTQDAADDELVQSTPRSRVSASVALTSIDKIFDEISDDIAKRQGLNGLQSKIEKLSNLSRKLTIAEWKRVVKRTLGIDIMEDYYKGARFKRIFDKWVADNVGLIKTIPQETLGSMRNVIKTGFLKGATNKTIAAQIQDAYAVSKSRARFITRDQISKLNSQVTREQQADAGVTEYVWRTTGDSRVRDDHADLNNTRQKWSSQPVVDKRTGRRGHPGEDYQCRCVALPVFDIDAVVLPWEKSTE